MNKLSPKTIWLLFILAAVSFLFTLHLSHIGEEGVYTISSFEMWYHKHYLYPLLYGTNYGRPPMFNWLIILLAKVVGWSNMLLASRLLTVGATIGSGLALAWLGKNIFRANLFAAFAALAYLTTDALLYHGWLAYSDPLFALFIFSAIACLWVAWEREVVVLLVIAVLFLTAAFLTKALTAYVFYLIAFSVLLWLGKRKFLLQPWSIVLHLGVFCFPLLWAMLTNDLNGSSLIRDIWYWGWEAGKNTAITTYIKQLVTFPLEIFVRILPISLVAIYYFWQGKGSFAQTHKVALKFLMLFVIISFMPYWLTTKHSARYILPLYPFIVLWCSYIVWHSGARALRVALIWCIAAIIIKYLTVIFWWPYYQSSYRGNYLAVAQDVTQYARDYSLYENNAGAVEHSVIDNINILRYPAMPLHSINLKASQESSYFVITTDSDFNSGSIVRKYTLGKSGKNIYLLCYGQACV